MTATSMTFDQFVAQVDAQHRVTYQHRGWRKGQTYFNLLETIRPDLAAQVRTQSWDPFYDNDRISEFLAFIADRW